MVSTATLSSAIGKFIQDKLIELAEQQHRFPQMCESVMLDQGNGKTCYMYLYDRIAIPLAPLTEGVTPQETGFDETQQTVTVDEQGLYVSITSMAGLTIKHPIFTIALSRIADAISRVKDYTIHDVVSRSTNKQFWDGSRADRAAITASDTFKKEVLAKAKVTLDVAGAGEREGGFYTIITDPNVMMDILTETASSNWQGYSVLKAYAGDLGPVEKGLVGAWLGFKFIKTNFIAVFTRWSNTVTATATTGGALSGTVYWKVVRRSTQDGFSDEIMVESSTAMGANTRLNFTAPSTSGYGYDIYVGSSTGDSNLYLAVQGLGASGSVNIDAVPTSGLTAPTTPAASVSVHQMCCFGKEAVDNVKLSGSSMEGMMTPKGNSDSDPLAQRRKMGSKYADKAGIRSNYRVLVIELASTYA